MKKLLLLLIPIIVSCHEEQTVSVVAIKNCVTQKWDTVHISYDRYLQIITRDQAVPVLVDAWKNRKALNVCEFKIITKK